MSYGPNFSAQSFVSCSTDRVNEVRKIFIIHLGSNRRVRFQCKQILEFSGRLMKYDLIHSQTHVLTERYTCKNVTWITATTKITAIAAL